MPRGKRTAKYRFKLLLIEAELWDDFKARREALKALGFQPAKVWQKLMPIYETLISRAPRKKAEL